MGIDSHFLHTCDIQHADETQDEYNENVKIWAAHLSDVFCLLVEKARREVSSESAENVLITTYLLLLPPDTDVEEDDRITNIRYEDGTTDSRLFDVESKLVRRTRASQHLSLQLERIR